VSLLQCHSHQSPVSILQALFSDQSPGRAPSQWSKPGTDLTAEDSSWIGATCPILFSLLDTAISCLLSLFFCNIVKMQIFKIYNVHVCECY